MNEHTTSSRPRWHNYVMERGRGLETFWETHLRETRDVLFILGKGFDPRMCSGIRALMNVGGVGKRDVVALEFDESLELGSKEYQPLVHDNWSSLEALMQRSGSLSSRPLRVWSGDGRRISARSATTAFSSHQELNQYADIFLDISALPRGVYLPLIAKLLHILDEKRPTEKSGRPNLHIVVAENPGLDLCILDEGIDENAVYLHPFAGSLEMEATAEFPKVWIPVLGERQATQLSRIYDLITPDEIAPVLPSPSVDPRRADNLLLEYRELLFDRLRVEPSNFIFASEHNPFEVYRQIRKTALHYGEVLQPLGGGKAVLSALSTKLVSIGVLLAAYELKQAKLDIGIAHVECQGYAIETCQEEMMSNVHSELFSLWLWGECYES